MEIHQLEYSVTVAETSGFSRTAERCNVTQPSLSQQIKKLEQEIGYQLFDDKAQSYYQTETYQKVARKRGV
jgi:LysR family hydrogen peroxide-inducible transcriptional activator